MYVLGYNCTITETRMCECEKKHGKKVNYTKISSVEYMSRITCKVLNFLYKMKQINKLNVYS